MPSLRELWQQVIMFDKREMSPRFCAVMERLVEAVEPQECPQGCDATIRKLRKELGTTKAEIERLHKARDIDEVDRRNAEMEAAYLTHVGGDLREELAEVKQRLKARRAMCKSWQGRCRELERLLAHKKASVAHAEIGRLILGMDDTTCLLRFIGGKFGVGHCPGGRGWKAKGGPVSADPAVVLRSIQEGDDGEDM